MRALPLLAVFLPACFIVDPLIPDGRACKHQRFVYNDANTLIDEARRDGTIDLDIESPWFDHVSGTWDEDAGVLTATVEGKLGAWIDSLTYTWTELDVTKDGYSGRREAVRSSIYGEEQELLGRDEAKEGCVMEVSYREPDIRQDTVLEYDKDGLSEATDYVSGEWSGTATKRVNLDWSWESFDQYSNDEGVQVEVETTVSADGVYRQETHDESETRTGDTLHVREFDGSSTTTSTIEAAAGVYTLDYQVDPWGDGSGTITFPDGSTCPIIVDEFVCSYQCEGVDPGRC